MKADSIVHRKFEDHREYIDTLCLPNVRLEGRRLRNREANASVFEQAQLAEILPRSTQGELKNCPAVAQLRGALVQVPCAAAGCVGCRNPFCRCKSFFRGERH